MRFEDLNGQEELAATLANEAKSGRPAHAYLLHGPKGSGQLPLGWAFASYLFCEAPGEDACGDCSACQRVASLSHPDLHFSFPFIKRSGQNDNSEGLQSFWRETIASDPFLSLEEWLRATGEENKQGVIPVAESELIMERLSLKAYEGGKKVLILWMAEKLNREAANKLLKVLEEPPPETVFILLSEDPGSILPTIRSRTRIHSLKPLSDEALKANLIRQAGISDEEAERIAGPADGDLSLAMELARHGDSGDLFKHFTEWMRIAFKGNIPEGMEWVESVAAQGREWHKAFLVYGLHMLRQCLLHELFDDSSKVRLSEEEKAFEEKFRHYVPHEVILSLSENFEKACRDIERNGNPRIIFFHLTLEVIQAFSTKKSKKSEA